MQWVCPNPLCTWKYGTATVQETLPDPKGTNITNELDCCQCKVPDAQSEAEAEKHLVTL